MTSENWIVLIGMFRIYCPAKIHLGYLSKFKFPVHDLLIRDPSAF